MPRRSVAFLTTALCALVGIVTILLLLASRRQDAAVTSRYRRRMASGEALDVSWAIDPAVIDAVLDGDVVVSSYMASECSTMAGRRLYWLATLPHRGAPAYGLDGESEHPTYLLSVDCGSAVAHLSHGGAGLEGRGDSSARPAMLLSPVPPLLWGNRATLTRSPFPAYLPQTGS